LAATAALGLSAADGTLVNGDWVNRALDELFDADRASLLTAVERVSPRSWSRGRAVRGQ